MGSSLLVFLLGIGIMLTLLYFASTYSQGIVTVSTKPRLSQNDAINIAESDLKTRISDYEGISRLIVNSTSGYIPIDEFRTGNSILPLIYVYPNGTLESVSTNGDDDLGRCVDGLSAYCGFLPPFNFNFKGRLVYAVEGAAKAGDGTIPFLYMIDAVNGKIVDSIFLRNGKLS